jgi:hypothetical protein
VYVNTVGANQVEKAWNTLGLCQFSMLGRISQAAPTGCLYLGP